ncbi:MAG: hypothetical protein ACRDP5_19775, partial [Streptosporangiaceae bacterium]
ASYQPKPRHQRPLRRPAGWRRWVKAHMAWVGWVSVGAALVVGGVILGASLSSSGSPPVPSGAPPMPPAPHTVCGTFQAGPGPGLCMVKQSRGLAGTAFAIQGNHFTPGSSVTFTVSEADPNETTLFTTTSPLHVTARPDGTFQVAFSRLYSRPLPVGLVTVNASGPGGEHVGTEFMIIPSGPPPT